MNVLLHYRNNILMVEVPRLTVRSGGWVPHEPKEHRTRGAVDLKHCNNCGSLLSYLDFYTLYLYSVPNQTSILKMTRFTHEKNCFSHPFLKLTATILFWWVLS